MIFPKLLTLPKACVWISNPVRPGTDVVREYVVYNLWEDGMATPSTFVLDRTGKIRWQHIGKTVYDRPSNEEIIDQLKKLRKG